MARWSQARYKDVVGRGRVDGEYHSHSARHLESRLTESSMPIYRLIDCCERITSGHTPLRHDLSCGDVFFVTVECISPLLIDYALTKRVRIDHYLGELSRVALTRKSVVVTIKRRIAQASPCYGLRGETVVNQDVAVLRLRDGWNPGFISAFLVSRFGQQLADRERTEQMNPYLPLNKLGNILVPQFNEEVQQSIDDLIKQRFECLAASEKSYSEAQNLLESELQLDKLKFQEPVGYAAQLNEAMTGGRIDADYFQPQYSVVRALIQAYPGGYEPLLNCADSLRPNIDPSKAPNHLFNYIELSNINASLGIVEGFLPSLGANLPSRAKRQVKTGDVIASAVVGSVDKAAIIAEEQNGFLASTGFFHLRPKSVSPVYLLMLVRSQCVRMQFQQQSTGGILSAVPDSRLKHVIIPKLPVALQEEIDCLVTKSHSAKHTSDVLLERAKSCVAQLIEEAVKS